MQNRIEIALQLVVFLVAGVLAGSAAAPQGNAPPSLQEQLEAQYQLTKMNGGTLVPGTVLVLQKEGVLAVPLSTDSSPVAAYKDGALRPPGADVLAHFGKDARPLAKGDKVYVTEIDVNLKEDWVRLHIVECGACNGVMPASAYKSAVGFQFAKGYLKTASVPDVEDIIAQVFEIYTPPETPPAPAPGQPGLVPAAPGQGLTNDDIIKLVQVKLADSLIIMKIKSSACAFDTGTDALIKLKQAGVSDAVLQAMVEGGGQPITEPPTQPAPPVAALTPVSCDYQSCLEGGRGALSRSQWDTALAAFQRASTLDPSKPDPWAEQGNVYLASGQYQNAAAMWDKALGLGGTLTFGAWHYKPGRFERGTFHLSAKEASFVLPTQAKVFSAAPTEFSSLKTHHPALMKNACQLTMKLEGHNYLMFFMPLGVECNAPERCNNPAGYAQEEAVANYIAQTFAKLAPGSAGK